MTRRTAAQRELTRADLLAALRDLEQRPARVDTVVAAAHGLTVATFPDHTWEQAWRDGCADLLVLHRAGEVVMNPPYRATYAVVDLPGSAMAIRLAELAQSWDDEAEVRRMLSRWEPVEPSDDALAP